MCHRWLHPGFLSTRTHRSCPKAATPLVIVPFRNPRITYPRVIVLVTLITVSLAARPRVPRAHAHRIGGIGSQSAPVATLRLKRKVHLPVLRTIDYNQAAHAQQPHSTLVDTTCSLGVRDDGFAVVVFDGVKHSKHLVVPAFGGRVKTLLEELQLEGAKTWGVVCRG